MSPESAPRALATARLEKAQALLEDAKLLFSVGQWASANNRAYYCLFHAMRAVLALEQRDFKKHSAVIAAFHRDYSHSGAFDRRFSAVISNASIIRNHSDYDDFYICSREETDELIRDADDFLAAVASFLRQQGCAL